MDRTAQRANVERRPESSPVQNKNHTELKEEELKRVSGGIIAVCRKAGDQN